MSLFGLVKNKIIVFNSALFALIIYAEYNLFSPDPDGLGRNKSFQPDLEHCKEVTK